MFSHSKFLYCHDQDYSSQIGMVTDGGVRKVKIQKSGENFVHVAEVEVYDGSGINKARGKNTAQSSTWQGNTAAFGPQKSVDGNTNTSPHTAAGDNSKCVD